MTSSETAGGRRRRVPVVWLAPVVAVAAIGVGYAALSAGASGSAPALPARSPAQLLTAVGTNAATSFSGTISQTSDLGLPALPGDSSTASLSWASFITGTHKIRIWADGRDKQRLAVIGQLSEADVVHNGRDVWTYTSESNSATHTVLPAKTQHRDSSRGLAEPTPAAVVARILKAVGPTTSVTLGAPQTVAGRSAYTLDISPRQTGSTVRKISIAIDSQHYVPLLVDVFGASSDPAVHIGFSDISYTTPAASTFTFHIPHGASVSTDPFGDSRPGWHYRSRVPNGPSPHPAAPRVLGTGWTSVLELHNSPSAVGGISGLLDRATTSIGSTGARLLHTALVNAVLMPDGRMFVGAVQPALLEHVAATTRN